MSVPGPRPARGEPLPEAAQMVRVQLESRGILDGRLLEAMRRIPRHLFVPSAVRAEAYADHPLPLGHGQTISQPYIVAVMTESLGLRGCEKVLEIGTGSGYQTAVLAQLAGHVWTVERVADLSRGARAVLEELGYANVTCSVGDGSVGLPGSAPFDAILVSAAAPRVPRALAGQLADGGTLVLPVGESRFSQTLVVVRRAGASFREERGIGCRFVPLLGADGFDP
jgi:protein-L-isoaspartate(D-aspartate) O-methyltransferase